MGVAGNLRKVQERVRQAALRARRDPGEIRLVAVSKTAGPGEIKEAYAAGLSHFGENRLQDAREKIPLCPPDITWHFIGHLQANKAKAVLEDFALIHSLDSCKLAARLNRLGLEAGKTARVLVQVNMAGEAGKQGVPPGEVEGFLRQAASLPGLDIQGLMAMAPFSADPEDSRPCFRAMRALFDSLKIPGVRMEILSMGMSGDFEVAVEEGATLLRIGSLIFLPEYND